MLPILEFNVYIPFSPRALIADRNTATQLASLALIVRDKRPVRVRFLKDGGQGTPELVDLGETANIALAGRAGDGMGESDSLIYLLNDFDRVEVQDGESNIIDVYYEGILDTNTTEAIAAVGENNEVPTWTEIEISNADFTRRATVLRMESTLKLDVYRGTEGAPSPADPLFLNQAQIEALLQDGELDMVVNSLVVDNPGLKTQSSVVALIDDGELIVPTPNTGNTLLIERDGGAGTTTVSTVSGLVPGAIYLLKNMDGGTLALAGDLNDSDSVDLPDGKTCWLYADTETTGHIIGWHLEETA